MIRHSLNKLTVIALISSALLLLSIPIVNSFTAIFVKPVDSGFDCAGNEREQDGSHHIYVPGAGFSGFFYTLGRLQAFHESNPLADEYYCYSGGCLALIASLMHLSVDTAVELAFLSRNRWNTGEISRYEVVEEFVDGLVNQDAKGQCINATLEGSLDKRYVSKLTEQSEFDCKTNAQTLQNILPRVNVMTSVWNSDSIPSRHIQKPTSIMHLRKMLVQTTWM